MVSFLFNKKSIEENHMEKDITTLKTNTEWP